MAILQIASYDHVFRVITGDGMEPEFNTGDELFTDFDRNPHHGDFVVAKLSEQSPYILSQLLFTSRKKILKSLNPAYPAIEIPNLSFIFGVVVLRGRAMDNTEVETN